MRTQGQRDEQTVAIATALGLFVVILIAVGLVLWVVYSVSDVLDGRTGEIFTTAAALAGILAMLNLVRAPNR